MLVWFEAGESRRSPEALARRADKRRESRPNDWWARWSGGWSDHQGSAWRQGGGAEPGWQQQPWQSSNAAVAADAAVAANSAVAKRGPPEPPRELPPYGPGSASNLALIRRESEKAWANYTGPR